MGDFDAAAIVGQVCGHSRSDPPVPAPVEPAKLVKAFCGDAAGNVPDSGTTEVEGVKTSRGWCGFRGGQGDSLEVGFDDGYDFMGYLQEHGWKALPAKGDWPFVVYVARISGETYAIAEYCETDLTVWQFASEAHMKEFYGGLRDARSHVQMPTTFRS